MVLAPEMLPALFQSLSLSSVLWLRRSGLVQSLHASTLQVFPVL